MLVVRFTADYSVDNILSVFEASYDENIEFNANSDAGACRRDDKGIRLPYL